MSQENSQTGDSTGSSSSLAVMVLRWAAISLGLGLIFAWFGVYQTSEIPFPGRVAYWTGLMGVGIVSSLIANPLVFVRWMPKAHPAIQIGVISLLISVPVTIGLVIIEAASDGTIQSPNWWGTQYLYVVVVSVILTALAWAAERVAHKGVVQPAAAPVATGAASAAFADRLPVKFRTGLIFAVSAEDHYLRIHTSVGETMILMRLADAVRELSALEGLQTHRSWWVAKQGLADVVKGDGKVTLKLKSGAEAPVSRTYVKAVRDAGWA